ncbi:hypothetical protein [Marinicellulosiphila megalodicopiae]|uniref:hypothetical protein n=1 Tax=Marinicellulosiphila megalodicopiae TaxID=2724896 RepID=UPI003BB1E236
MEENIKNNSIDYRSIRYKGLNKIVTTGWMVTVCIMMIPLWIYLVIHSSGTDRFIIAAFFPFGMVIFSFVSAQFVVLSIFVGLRLHKLVFR